MKMALTLAAAPALTALCALPMQGEKDSEAQVLRPLEEGAEAQERTDRRARAEDPGAVWKRNLCSSDLALRERTYEELLRAARSNPAALALLRDWSQDAADVELAWTARLALRELQMRRDPFTGFHDHFLRGFAGLGGPDGWGWPFGGFGGTGGFGGPGGFGGFGDLQRFFEELQRDLGQLLPRGGTGAAPAPAPLPPGASSRSERFELRSGPAGVEVRIFEEVDGEERESLYEADSLEDLLRQHPELEGRVRIGPALPGGALDRIRSLRERLQGSPFGGFRAPPSAPPAVEKIATDRLGVMMREPGSYERDAEGVLPGVGLLVESTLPHSIAGELDVQPGDLLVELNGVPLRGAGDVRRALSQRGDGEPVVLTLIDPLGQRRVLTWRPDAVEDRGPRALRRTF